MPRGVPSEGRLVLTGCSFTVDLVLYHRYAVQLGASPEEEGGGKEMVKIQHWGYAVIKQTNHESRLL